MPSTSESHPLCPNCGTDVPRRNYQRLAREVVASIQERTAVELLDAADEIALQTKMSVVLVVEEMLSALKDDAVSLYLRHPSELPARV